MGRDTLIGWCDSSVNGSSGCGGCELWNGQVRTCYAGNLQTARLSKSMPGLYSADFSEVRMIPGRFAQAASWSDLRGTDRPDKPWLNGLPRCIFVGDMGDFLSREVTDEFLKRELLGAVTSKQGQRHFWMWLTKRPGRLAALSDAWGGLPDNVMAMTTVTCQHSAEARVRKLLSVKCKWKGISAEPLLTAVDLERLMLPQLCDSCGNRVYLNALTGFTYCHGMCDGPGYRRLDWVISGYESGPGCRPGLEAWAAELRDQCAGAGVPFFHKQNGGTGKSKGGRLLEGKEHNGFPGIAA